MSCCKQEIYLNQEVKITDYASEVQPTWCGGCGNYGIWTALKRALVELQIPKEKVVMVFDVGCNGNMSDKIRGYRVHSLHGRSLPLASAIKIANPELTVIAIAGDGATYSEGIGHFANTVRNNYPITFLVHNNGTYGLTTGQASATTPEGAKRNSNPDGPTASVLDPIDFALALSPGFIARGFSGEIENLKETIKQSILYQDKGLAYVDILQSCPTFNKETTHFWYQENTKNLNNIEDASTKPIYSSIEEARDMMRNDAKVALGVLYKNENNPSYLARLEYREQSPHPVNEVKKFEVEELLSEFY